MTIKTNSFQELLNTSDKPILVDFWAEWCGPCKVVSPTIEKIAKAYKGKLSVIKINVDKKPQISAQFQIKSIPTIMLFKNGKPVMREAGALSFDQLKYKIDGVL